MSVVKKLAKTRTKTRRAGSPQLHPAFAQLPADTEVWRFVDLAKLVDCMRARHLYLARLDRMHDKFEGSIPPLSRLLEEEIVATQSPRERRFKRSDPQRELAFRSSVRRQLVAHTYVSCWRHGEEIEAMWRLYCGQSEGVALRTTYGKLRDSIAGPKTFIGAVRYIDYRRDLIDTSNLFTHLMHKRSGFAHEQEVRILRELLTSGRGDAPEGVTIPWNVARTIEEVVVTPYAGRWYFDCIAAVVTKFCPRLAGRVRWSSLYGDPLY